MANWGTPKSCGVGIFASQCKSHSKGCDTAKLGRQNAAVYEHFNALNPKPLPCDGRLRRQRWCRMDAAYLRKPAVKAAHAPSEFFKTGQNP